MSRARWVSGGKPQGSRHPLRDHGTVSEGLSVRTHTHTRQVPESHEGCFPVVEWTHQKERTDDIHQGLIQIQAM